MRAVSWARERLATAPAIYGLIAYEALIAATSDVEDQPLVVTFTVALELLVFFIAHAFAEVIAGLGPDRLYTAIGRGISHSLGMLYAAILPTVALLVCDLARTNAEVAADWALGVGLVVLAFLGYQAMAERGATTWRRVLGALGTAAFGLVVMLLYYLLK